MKANFLIPFCYYSDSSRMETAVNTSTTSCYINMGVATNEPASATTRSSCHHVINPNANIVERSNGCFINNGLEDPPPPYDTVIVQLGRGTDIPYNNMRT